MSMRKRIHQRARWTSHPGARLAGEGKDLANVLSLKIWKSFSRSSMLRPAAIDSTSIPTVTRIPRMHGLPPITAGSMVMRRNSCTSSSFRSRLVDWTPLACRGGCGEYHGRSPYSPALTFACHAGPRRTLHCLVRIKVALTISLAIQSEQIVPLSDREL